MALSLAIEPLELCFARPRADDDHGQAEFMISETSNPVTFPVERTRAGCAAELRWRCEPPRDLWRLFSL